MFGISSAILDPGKQMEMPEMGVGGDTGHLLEDSVFVEEKTRPHHLRFLAPSLLCSG